MDYIISDKIEKNERNGFTLTLFLDKNATEFSNELGTKAISDQTSQNIVSYVKRSYPKLKITTVKVVVGSIIVMSLALITDDKAHAATTEINSFNDISSTTKQHTVISGDSLYKIAMNYNTSVEKIKVLNKLSSNNIYVGQVLAIPTVSTTSQNGGISYTVKFGDSLSLIAKEFNTTTEQIKQLNGLTSDMIYVAQKLNIPVNIVETEYTTSYIVVSSDTLSGIAKKFEITVDQLKITNKLSSDIIYIGQKLQIPTSKQSQATKPQGTTENRNIYTVMPGDYLSKIAKQNDVSVEQLKSANNLTGDMIFPGQKLIIPASTGTIPTQTNSDTTVPNTSVTNEKMDKAQTDLKTLGFFNDTETYNHAITTFQQAYGLPQTGQLDTATKNQLDHAVVKKQLVSDTYNFLGVPYQWGGTTPSGFDCSGFVYFMFNRNGVEFTRTSSGALYQTGTSINKSQLQVGDLVFFAVNQPGAISHVGFYTGKNSFISATTSKGIWEYSLDSPYWSNYYVGAKRVY